MSATPIQAVDERVMPFAPESIWAVLLDVAAYPQWWPRSVSVTVLSAAVQGAGSEVKLTPRGGRAFRCRVESLFAPRRMTMRYGDGFITGTGEWRLEPVNGGTRLVYDLNVVAEGWLAALLAHVMLLGKQHSKSMHELLECLERETARRG
jgi:uncharacterized protein YndB with AHSA1/START domain